MSKGKKLTMISVSCQGIKMIFVELKDGQKLNETEIRNMCKVPSGMCAGVHMGYKDLRIFQGGRNGN